MPTSDVACGNSTFKDAALVSSTGNPVSYSHRPPPRSADRSGGFTILELLTCIGVMTVLIAILLPALSSARESARRVQCNNHLKQIGLALHSYHEVNQCLPPAWRWDTEQRTAFGWLPPMLPFLEKQQLYEQVEFNEAVDAEQNALVRSVTYPDLLCPSDLTQRTFMLYAEPANESDPADVPMFQLPAASYVGVFGINEPDDVWKSQTGVGVFCGTRPTRFHDVTRGLSNVLIVGERRASTIPSTWLGIDFRGEDAHCRILGNTNLGPNVAFADECEFTSRHPGLANFLWADGHVQAVSEFIDSAVYRQMSRRGADWH